MFIINLDTFTNDPVKVKFSFNTPEEAESFKSILEDALGVLEEVCPEEDWSTYKNLVRVIKDQFNQKKISLPVGETLNLLFFFYEAYSALRLRGLQEDATVLSNISEMISELEQQDKGVPGTHS